LLQAVSSAAREFSSIKSDFSGEKTGGQNLIRGLPHRLQTAGCPLSDSFFSVT